MIAPIEETSIAQVSRLKLRSVFCSDINYMELRRWWLVVVARGVRKGSKSL